MTRLFAYGTLRDRVRLATVVGSSHGWRALGPATIDGQLYHAGRYPALRLDPGPHDAISGELIEFDDPAVLHRLDAYEGVDEGLYTRREVLVAQGGRAVSAWVYVYKGPVADLPRITAWP